MKEDPNEQAFRTFGSSPAALRLKKEIDQPGAKYESAIRMLNLGEARANEIFYSKMPSRVYFLQLLRREVVERINGTKADYIIKSLARNIFIAKIRVMLKAASRKVPSVEPKVT